MSEAMRLDHVNVRTANLEAMKVWYADVVGLKPGKRPNFPFPGAWMYAGDQAVLHLVETKARPDAEEAGLRIEHFALRAHDLPAFLEKLKAHDVTAQLNHIADVGITQVNIVDPDGNHIHIDFAEAPPA